MCMRVSVYFSLCIKKKKQIKVLFGIVMKRGKNVIVSADTKPILLILGKVECLWTKASLGFPPETSFDYEPLS